MSTVELAQSAAERLRALEAEQAGLEEAARQATLAGDAKALAMVRRRREELPDELALAEVEAHRRRIEALQADLAAAQAALHDPERQADLAHAVAAVPAAQEALRQAQQAATAASVRWQAAQARVDTITAQLVQEHAALRARTTPPPPTPPGPPPATRLVYGGPGKRPDASYATPPPLPDSA